MDQKLADAVSVFVQLALLRNAKLEFGMRMRQEMHKALEEGRRPPGYRADWIKSSAATMVSVLGEIAKDFNTEHPDDTCSLADLMDITATTMGLLKRSNGEEDEEDD